MNNEDLRQLMYTLAETDLIERCKSIKEFSSPEEFDIVKQIVRENIDIEINIIPDTTYTETTLREAANKLLRRPQ